MSAVHAETNPFLGRWQLNVAQSHVLGTAARSGFRSYEDRGCGVILGTRDVTLIDGTHSYDHYAARYDSKYYPIVIRPTTTDDEIEFHVVTPLIRGWSIKQDGKVLSSGTSEVSPNGRVLTVTTRSDEGVDIEVYDRE